MVATKLYILDTNVLLRCSKLLNVVRLRTSTLPVLRSYIEINSNHRPPPCQGGAITK
mgnify:FL=1